MALGLSASAYPDITPGHHLIAVNCVYRCIRWSGTTSTRATPASGARLEIRLPARETFRHRRRGSRQRGAVLQARRGDAAE